MKPEVTGYKVLYYFMEGLIYLPILSFAQLSQWLESRVCGQMEYLLDKVLHLKGNCVQMLACFCPVLHMWIRLVYISPDSSLVLPDETFLAAEREVCLMWLYRLSHTLKLCCFLSLVIFLVRSSLSDCTLYDRSTSSRCCGKYSICSMSSPQNSAYFNDLSQSGMSCWISFHSLNF